MAELYDIEARGLGSDVVFVAFRGSEAVSRTYRYAIFVTLPLNAGLTVADVLGTAVVLSIHHEPEGEPQRVSGVVAGFDVVHAVDERMLCRVDVVPKLWQLSQSRHSRVFPEMALPDFVAEVLDGAGIRHELRLEESYEAEAHVCQYKESDLDFVQRWLEREGIVYFFEHTADGETMIIADHPSAHPAGPAQAVRYLAQTGGSAGEARGAFRRFSSRRRLLPSKVRATDYDPARPSLAIEGEAAAVDGLGGEVVLHGVRTIEPSRAKAQAALQAAALVAEERTFRAEGGAFGVAAGLTFDLVEHPRGARNTTYLCTELERMGNARATTDELRRMTGVGEESYLVRPLAIEASVPLRPRRVTAWPRVHGVERATIDGDADSDYAQLDDAGRYLVRFGFDERDNADGAASTRIRMLQPHAGSPEGWHLPLRKGTEVMVAFLAGDPDRPVIAGAVPNAETPSPVTSDNNTRNVFITGGENWIEIEDQDGAQWIDIRSPTEESYLHLGKPHDGHSHYIVGHTDADCLFSIGTDQLILVGGKLTEKVTGDVTETYNTSQTTKVTGDQTTIVHNDVIEKYTGGQKTDVTGATTEIYVSKQTTDVSGGRWELYDTQQTTLCVGGIKQTFNAAQNFDVNGPSIQVYNGPKTTSASGAAKYELDSTVVQLFGPTVETHASTTWNITGAANYFTSNWTLFSGAESDTCAAIDILKAVFQNVTVISISRIGLKLEATGFQMGATGLKVEGVGACFEAIAIAIGLKLAEIDTSGLRSDSAGLDAPG